MQLLVVWPKSFNEIDYFEQQYATKFCKNYLLDSLKEYDIEFNWVDFEETIIPLHRFTKYILVINDPLIVLSGAIIKMMMDVIDMGYFACGPRLNVSSNNS